MGGSCLNKEYRILPHDFIRSSYWDRICKIEFDTEDEPLIEIIDGEEWIRVVLCFILTVAPGKMVILIGLGE